MLRQWVRRPVLHPAQAWRKTSLHTFCAGDNVILYPKLGGSEMFIDRLRPGKQSNTHKGPISHDDIIGRTPRSVISARTRSDDHAAAYRLQEPTLEEYIKLTRRLVTPIYPTDARLIVELFELHPETFNNAAANGNEPTISILEAGTGHGALTLYLSRAIHAANSPAPNEDASEDDAVSAVLEAWKATRHAVVHSVDVSSKHSKHATSIVKGFRRGMYHGNVDFHVCSVSNWIEEHLTAKGQSPFLTHAFLDLPQTDTHVSTVARALQVDSPLIVFTPSITQILELTIKVKNDNIPLFLDKVIELGVNGGTGGRAWDVRPVRPKSASRLEPSEVESDGEVTRDESLSDDTGSEGDASELAAQDAHEIPTRSIAGTSSSNVSWSMICRPKVGDRIVGGGFLAIYKKEQR